MTQHADNRVFLGLGANLGQPLEQLQEARKLLSRHRCIDITASSPLYRTPALGGPAGQPDYGNAVLQLTTSLPPRELLDCCLEIEAACGRTRTARWAPRTLDIDLLFYGQTLIEEPGLVLPHPRLHVRHFVLLPLADLAPELKHPRLNQTIGDLLHGLPAPEGICKIMEKW
ncbi:MAG: 2-amino-4-hydroxy-6-hydroxymethyldihydropteridine diphosphokinase [Desulfuromonadales bacterium]|nr:2-amino-4-hydroxy-6-hydroxymethyldihydropteridine diphosphokinase [Desulfuromonadales bacterium]